MIKMILPLVLITGCITEEYTGDEWIGGHTSDLLEENGEPVCVSNPKQREHINAALNASGVFELDPIKDKKEIKSIINNLRARNADEVLDFILVQIADQVLKVNV